MKKLFTEPEIEILNFLCDTAPGIDSADVGLEDGGAEGELPLP